jgi:hypothetical protein
LKFDARKWNGFFLLFVKNIRPWRGCSMQHLIYTPTQYSGQQNVVVRYFENGQRSYNLSSVLLSIFLQLDKNEPNMFWKRGGSSLNFLGSGWSLWARAFSGF